MKQEHIQDLSNDIRPKKAVSTKMRRMLDAEKINTRKRIAERGIVHFRADKEFMEGLFDAADKLKIAPGTLCRQVVWEYLKSQKSASNSLVKRTMASKRIDKALVAKLSSLEHIIKEIQAQITAQP